jgi:hypothetical protein
MENTGNNNETLVNYLSTSTSAVNQNYFQPTVNTESLSFKMKNNFILTFSMPDVEPQEISPKIEKDETIEK